MLLVVPTSEVGETVVKVQTMFRRSVLIVSVDPSNVCDRTVYTNGPNDIMPVLVS